MATTVTIDLRHVARGLGIPLRQVQAVVELLDEGNTVPFITRYRKDQTGGLDEEQIRQVQARLAKMRLLADRKQTILRSIEAQGKLTEKLTKQILSAGTTKRLEDLYLPYKPKKQTLATLARSRGLETLTREILEADPACADLDARAADFVNPDRQVLAAADALLGAGHILAEQFSERADLRQGLREILQRTGKFVCTRIDTEGKAEAEKPEAKPAAVSQTAEDPTAEDPTAEDSSKQPAETAETPDGPAEKPAEASETAEGTESLGEQPSAASESLAAAAEQPVEVTDSPGEKPTVASQSLEAAPEQPVEVTDSPGEKPTVASQSLEAAAEQPVEVTDSPGEKPTTASQSADNPGEESTQPSPAEDGAAERPPVALDRPESVNREPAEAPVEEPSPPADQPNAATVKTPARRSAKTPPKTDRGKPRPSKRELKRKSAEEKKIKAFRDYFDYREEIKKIPPHRVLAINRGERAKVLRVKIETGLEAMHQALDELLIPPEHPHADYLQGCARDALSRLILPSLEREIRRELTDRAETHAVDVFARNLRNLLLQPPVRDRRTLAVDPGYKSGCKLAALDQFGNLLEHGVIYLVGRPERRQQAREKVLDLIRRFQLSVVTIGNGTACRECEDFFAELVAGELKDQGVAYVIVNEAGASVYSTSRVGREEFPNYDATLRGAISIGRRLQDPLSELVKIDAASIGVGLYQHDVKAKHLRTSLDEVVESCVNYVGVNVNTASPALLRYVSGLNQLTARRVHEHRLQHGPFHNREQLREVPGFGEATFVQAAGFLKIRAGDNPLDATWIHPESYEVAKRVLESLQCAAADLTDKEKAAGLAERVAGVNLEEMARQLEVGTLTLEDILAQLARPGRDPREDLPAPVFKQGVLKLEDLQPGMELTGTVLNVVDFGAFVDIGMHDSGLVHVSQLADKYVRDPHEVVAVGDIVKVWVIDVDKERRRVSLTMVQPGTQRPRRGRQGGKPAGGKDPSAGGDRSRGEKPAKTPPSGPPRSDGSVKGRGTSKARGSSKGKGPRRGKRPPQGERSPRPRYRPKPPPKPVTPISDDMKAGKEPMRTFGDLAQFFEHQRENDDGADDRKERQTPKDETEAVQAPAPPTQDEAPRVEAEAQPPRTETQDTEQEPPTTKDELPPQDETQSTPEQGEGMQQQGKQEG